MGSGLVPRDIILCTDAGRLGLSGRVAARRARFLMYSLANTFSPRGGGGFSPRGNLLAKQPGSNPVGSGSKHIDCSIWAQLPHPTGILVRFGVALGKKIVDHAFHVVLINQWDDGHRCAIIAKISLHFPVELRCARKTLSAKRRVAGKVPLLQPCFARQRCGNPLIVQSRRQRI